MGTFGTRRDQGAAGRRWRRVLLPVAATVVLSGCWLQPGSDPHRSGHNPNETRLTTANVASLTEAWSVTVGAGPAGAPIVSRHGVHAVSGRTLATYRPADGSEVWSVDVWPEFPGIWAAADPPRVRGDRLYVPVRTETRYAWTSVFDATTGAVGEGRTPYGKTTLDGDTLVGTDARFLGTDWVQPFLHSTDLDDPSRSWEAWYQAGDYESAVSDDWIVTIDFGGPVHGFPRTGPSPELCEEIGDPERNLTCRPAWTTTLGGHSTAPAISDDGQTVFVGDATGTLSALAIDDGTVRWTARAGSGVQIVAAPTVGDGSVFVTTSDGRLFAFDAGGCDAPSCGARWVTPATGSLVRHQAALAGGVIYVGADDGSVRAFDASGCGATTCEPVWRTTTGSPITGAPAVSDGRLFVGTADGRVVAYRPAG
jgi:outer membrane protein assembly factor BamB